MSNQPHFQIESLLDSAAFPHAVDQIQLLQTHISWIILTGEFAYKLKKPVDLGFLDFSTFERRKHFCNEELRLNSRLAPELYLNVVPITGSFERPRLGGAGEAFEYAVKMRQFPQHALLAEAITRDEISARHIDRLAEQVARFHDNIETALPCSAFGNIDSVWQPIDENLQRLSTAPDNEWTSRIDRLKQWSAAELERLRSTLAQRKAEGFVRECHGDMHLGNMILDGQDVVIFDGIEFNDNFRWIDVISEVAFVVMDLKDRGRPDFARRFLNTYLEHTGDYAALAVLPFYETYRALVRAKVDQIRSEQNDLSANDREAVINECHHYISLAEQTTKPTQPKLFITHGLSGSGKTTGSQQLVDELGAIRIRSDVERKRLLGLSVDARTSSTVNADAYSAANSRRTYDRLASLAQIIVKAGYSVVVDATFLKRDDRDRFHQLANEFTVPFAIVPFDADVELLKRRILDRAKSGNDASEATIAVLEQQLQSVEPITTQEAEFIVNG